MLTESLKKPNVSYFITLKDIRNLYKGKSLIQKLNSLGYEKVKLNTEYNNYFYFYKHKVVSPATIQLLSIFSTMNNKQWYIISNVDFKVFKK